MNKEPNYCQELVDEEWGCEFFEVESGPGSEKVKVCYVKVKDVRKIAVELVAKVLDTSWMMDLDPGSRRAYDKTVKETAEALVEIFESTATDAKVGSEFGEVMVSIGSSRALERLFDHFVLPVAELWKPQKKQNEGFDFHTVCKEEIINFGEAKFSAKKNPHSDAIDQAQDFIDNEKHYRDRVHLVNLVSPKAIGNLDGDSCGVVAAFSVNAVHPKLVFENAIDAAREKLDSECIKSVYLVGVSK